MNVVAQDSDFEKSENFDFWYILDPHNETVTTLI